MKRIAKTILIFSCILLPIIGRADQKVSKITQANLAGYWKVFQLSQYEAQNTGNKVIHNERLDIKSVLRLLPDGKVRVNDQKSVNWAIENITKDKKSNVLILATSFKDSRGADIVEKLFLKPINLVRKTSNNIEPQAVKNDLINSDEHMEMTLRRALDLRNPKSPVMATDFKGKLIIKNGIIEELYVDVSGRSILVENVEINTNSAIYNGYSILIRPFKNKKEYIVNLIGGPLDRMKLVFWDDEKIKEARSEGEFNNAGRLAENKIEQNNIELSQEERINIKRKEEEAIAARELASRKIEEKVMSEGVVF